MTAHWILVTTKPQQEDWAALNIHQLGCEVYLPKCWETRIINGRALRRLRPLFPRYLFVRIETQWRFLLSAWGASGVVMFGESPEPVRDSVVEAVRARAGADGHISLKDETAEPFPRGARVAIKAGPLAHLEGLYAGMTGRQRNRVLLDILGRETVVEVGASNIEAAE